MPEWRRNSPSEPESARDEHPFRVDDVPDHLKEELTIHLISTVEEVLPLVMKHPEEHRNVGDSAASAPAPPA